MKKTELVQKIAENKDVLDAGISKKSVEKVLNAILITISEELARGGQVGLTGFGTFLTKKREAREGRNPQTGEPLQIPSAVVPSFKVGKTLKDNVNKDTNNDG